MGDFGYPDARPVRLHHCIHANDGVCLDCIASRGDYSLIEVHLLPLQIASWLQECRDFLNCFDRFVIKDDANQSDINNIETSA